MYDYTFSIPHGVINLTSGIAGLVMTGNRAFAVSAAFGVLLLAISVRSLKRFFRGKLSPDGVILSLAMAVVNVYLMHGVLGEVKAWYPAGFLRAVSGFMAVYYVWNLLFGFGPLDPPPPYSPPKKTE